jgi:hypothetical protein
VRWTQIGFHRWPGATDRRAYLANRHRHLFHFAATISVTHDDREVEFHDLLDLVRNCTAGWGEELGGKSCEQMAELILVCVGVAYPARAMSVTVSEDGEVEATVSGVLG